MPASRNDPSHRREVPRPLYQANEYVMRLLEPRAPGESSELIRALGAYDRVDIFNTGDRYPAGVYISTLGVALAGDARQHTYRGPVDFNTEGGVRALQRRIAVVPVILIDEEGLTDNGEDKFYRAIKDVPGRKPGIKIRGLVNPVVTVYEMSPDSGTP